MDCGGADGRRTPWPRGWDYRIAAQDQEKLAPHDPRAARGRVPEQRLRYKPVASRVSSMAPGPRPVHRRAGMACWRIQGLADAGCDVRLNIVGFALDRRTDRRAMAGLAEVGGGAYFDARRGDDLAAALSAAISMPYRVLDEAGAEVAQGTIGGEPASVATGTYVVFVETSPPVRFDEVYVAPGRSVELSLPVSEETEAAP